MFLKKYFMGEKNNGLSLACSITECYFYYRGLFCFLHGNKEHHSLKYSQFTVKEIADPKNCGEMTTCVVYNEHGSKNHQGGAHQVHLENKSVTH